MMTKRYSIADARANLGSIIDEVIAGNEVELTRRGEAVAVVISRWLFDRMEPKNKSFGEAFDAWRERHPGDEIGDVSDVFADLRSSEPGRPVDL